MRKNNYRYSERYSPLSPHGMLQEAGLPLATSQLKQQSHSPRKRLQHIPHPHPFVQNPLQNCDPRILGVNQLQLLKSKEIQQACLKQMQSAQESQLRSSAQISNLLSHINDLQQKVGFLSERNSKLIQECRNLKSAQDRSMMQINLLEDKLAEANLMARDQHMFLQCQDDLQKQNKQLQNALQSLSADFQNEKGQRLLTHKELQQATMLSSAFKLDFDRQKEQRLLLEKQIQRLHSHSLAVNNQTSMLSGQYKRLLTRLSELQEDNHLLNLQLRNQSESQQLQSFRIQNQRLLAELNQLKLSIANLKFQTEGVLKINQSLQADKQQLLSQVEHLNNQIQSLSHYLQQSQLASQQHLHLEHQHLQLIENYQLLQDKLAETCSKLSMVHQQFNSFQRQNDLLRTSNLNLQDEIDSILSLPIQSQPLQEKVYVAVGSPIFERQELMRNLKEAHLQIQALRELFIKQDQKQAPAPPSAPAHTPLNNPVQSPQMSRIQISAPVQDHSECERMMKELQGTIDRLRLQLNEVPQAEQFDDSRYKKAISDRDQLIKKLKDQHRSQESALRSLKDRLADKERDCIDLSGELARQKDDCQERINQLLMKIKKLQGDCNSLKKQNERIKPLERKLNDQSNELTRLKKLLELKESQLHDLHQAKDQLQNDLHDVIAERDRLKSVNEDLLQKLNEAYNSLANLQKLNKNLKKLNDQINNRLKEALRKQSEAEREAAKWKAAFQNKSKVCDQLEAQNSTLKRENQELNQRLSEAIQQHSPCDDLIRSLNSQLKSLQAKLQRTDKLLKEANRPKKSQPVKDLSAQLQSAKQQLQSLLQQLARLKNQKCRRCPQLQRKLDSLQAKINQLADENQALKKDLDQLDKLNDLLKNDLSSSRRQKPEDCSKWKTMVADRDRKLKQQQAEIDKFKRLMLQMREGMVKSRVKGDQRILQQFGGTIQELMNEVKKSKVSSI